MAQKKSKLIWVWLATVAITVWFFATDEPRATVETWLAEHGIQFSKFSDEEAFEVFDTVLVPPSQGTSKIRGVIRNKSNRHYRVVRVIFDLVDENGKKVDSVAKYLSALGPGETRAFETSTHGAGFSDFRVKEATGW
jgi:KaiC/GvpD/RAD55 family RecA-like ATPase